MRVDAAKLECPEPRDSSQGASEAADFGQAENDHVKYVYMHITTRATRRGRAGGGIPYVSRAVLNLLSIALGERLAFSSAEC